MGERRWKAFERLGVNNALINRRVRPATIEALHGSGEVATSVLDVSRDAYFEFLEAARLDRYRGLGFVHTKPLEYLVSIMLTSLDGASVVLDAAGGGGEFVRALEALALGSRIYCQDPVLEGRSEGAVAYLGGTIVDVPLPDGSVDSITCHHSFEHFRGDQDVAFVVEACRLLRPGGRACVVPLFLTDGSFEIWNVRARPKAAFSAGATQLYDPTATFAGWGPYERFARTYSPRSFVDTFAGIVPADFALTVVRILVDGQPCPDLKQNRHQPLCNGDLKALVIARPG